jgi:hypothetical protein
MKITYNPHKDELVLGIYPKNRRPSKEFNHFKLWFDDDNIIIAITSFTDEIEEFKKNLNTIQLKSIWKDVKIMEEDIKETRLLLLKELMEK